MFLELRIGLIQKRKKYTEKLDSLLDQIKRVGYVAFTDSIPLDLDNNTKEKVLHRHCERIAITFALISMPVGKTITVKKNLRVVGIEIIVSDKSRFHHFEDGSCFGGDYW
ncbi:pentatricopeptide repeat-containing protein DWY1, chloroplastic-like [Camellia sinensis]|uniref:pentatricopeptide repeat-containing protein DWY1, chloroplastic-like n=1 Tax=Camellia sinensis TaxID=4442 RepID=UPI0010366488|nr:pentatricopeptide repeat-containing protein DWY1, chloroplastic-like [Camellia sinensis]